MKKVALIFLLYFSANAYSSEFRLVVPTVSTHVGDFSGYDVQDGRATIGELTGGTGVSSVDSISVLVGHEEELNNENYGIGIEVEHKGFLYTLISLKNSFNERSIYVGLSDERRLNKYVYVSYGLFAANGYDMLSDAGYLASPNLSIRFGDFRVFTTYPFANMTCPIDECADVVNLQYVMSF